MVVIIDLIGFSLLYIIMSYHPIPFHPSSFKGGNSDGNPKVTKAQIAGLMMSCVAVQPSQILNRITPMKLVWEN